MVKELENIRTSKNAELRDKIFNPDLNSTSNILFHNKMTHKLLNKGKSKDKIFPNTNTSSIVFTSPNKDTKKCSKILSFFKRNINALINLIPREENPSDVFEMSRKILGKQKSSTKYRPYSVSSNNTPLAASNWISNGRVRPFTENRKFRQRKITKATYCDSNVPLTKMKKTNSNLISDEFSKKRKEEVIDLNTFTINSSSND